MHQAEALAYKSKADTLKEFIGMEQSRVQRLLNQLMSQDPMTLAALNQVTDPGLSNNEAFDYISQSDEAETDRLEQHLEQGELSDEFAAAGWTAINNASNASGSTGGSASFTTTP